MARAENGLSRGRTNPKRVLSLLPLRGVLVFPNMTIPLEVGRDRSIAALDEAMSGDRLVLLAAQKAARVNEPSPSDIFEMGTISEIKQLVRLPDGTVRVVVEGRERARILDYVDDDPCYMVKVQIESADEQDGPEIAALARNALHEFEEYVKLS